MLEVVPYAIMMLLVVGAWAAGLAYFDVFTSEDVKAWRRLAELRGYSAPRGSLEKLASRARWISRFQDNLDLERLLGVVGRSETSLGFLGRSAAIGMIVMATALALDFGYSRVAGDWLFGLGPIAPLLAGPLAFFIQILDLRGEARRRQTNAGRSLSDMMTMVAIMTDGRGLQLEDAVRILSRSISDESLESIVDHRGYQRLVKTPHHNTIELYRSIAEQYRIPEFTQLADAAANTNVGLSERGTYTRLARASYQQRLAEARVKASRAKILVTIPVAGMLLPLLILIGVPTFNSILTGIGGH